jgi:hypothetical protein
MPAPNPRQGENRWAKIETRQRKQICGEKQGLAHAGKAQPAQPVRRSGVKCRLQVGAGIVARENKSHEKPMRDASGKTRNLFGALAAKKSLRAWAPRTRLHGLTNQSDCCFWLGHGRSRREMEKSPARLPDEAESEWRKLSRETRAATGPVPDAISTENEEQITAENLERRRKIEW